MYQDKQLVCADCGAEFVFTAGEQEFHASKGFTSEPRRCPACRAKRKSASGGAVRPENNENAAPPRPARPMYDAVCAECGKTTKVPFQPTGSRPVYCSDCYHTKGAAGGPRPSDSARSGGGSFQRPSGGGGAPKPAGGRSFGGGRSEARSAGPRESSFDSFDFSDYGDFGGDPYGAPNPGRGSRKRNNKRENKERSRKEGGGGRPKGRYNFDDDDDEMYY